MREVHPTARELDDVTAAVWSEHRPQGRWLMANMVSSLDGAATVDGRSGDLGGPGDRAVFGALRSRADVVLVGAATANAERYRPPRSAEPGRREAAGMAARPTIAVVTGSLSVDPGLPLFGDPDARPTVITRESADAARRERLAEVADVVTAGRDEVDLPRAVEELVERHGPAVLCEGGPSLLDSLRRDDLVDDWYVTIAATAVGGPARRITDGPTPDPRPLHLERVWIDHDELLLRYRRTR